MVLEDIKNSLKELVGNAPAKYDVGDIIKFKILNKEGIFTGKIIKINYQSPDWQENKVVSYKVDYNGVIYNVPEQAIVK